MSVRDTIADWYLSDRGIKRETLQAFNLEVEPNGTTRFPYPNGAKERPNVTVPIRDDQRRFYFTSGKSPALFQLPSPPQSETCFLVEGETDTMRLQQEVDGLYPVFGLGGINCWNESAAARLASFSRVYVILDNDQDYKVAGVVDDAWRKIRHDLGAHAKRVFLPKSCKDICEFFLAGYDLESLHSLCQRSAVSLYSPIDFTVSPPPVRWLVDGVFAMGDVTVLSGLGGLGKSFITMALTLAMLRGDDTFLGRKLEQHGKILYVDEENPLDVVHDRLRKMGLSPGDHAGSLRYLWNQHVRLDKDPERLLDECLAFGPDLLVVDSLTRVHGVGEDGVDTMGPLMNDGIKPLARESGAAVIVVHHHDKSGKGARGSSDIVNAADGAYNVHSVSDLAEKMKLSPAKSRRKRSFDELFLSIDDQADGTIKLNVVDPIQLSF